MEQNKEQRQIELLKILAKGCKKHPAYRAIRKATEKCEECVYVWQARVELNALEKDLWVLQMSYFCSKYGYQKEWVSICYNCIRDIRSVKIRFISQIENIKRIIRCNLNQSKIYIQLFEVEIWYKIILTRKKDK